jgi:SAM-dependent methyltransferase
MDNLDLQRLAEDGLAWIPGLAPVFRRALEGLTVLDPTCGSGAFLAAAADVLEPLCAACGAEPRFKNHLYGVDLHEDAVARCRRRLEQRLGGPVPDGNLRVGDALLDSGPFWSSAFPAVMAAGGFDVILGNPPFARIPREASRPLLRADYRSARPRWSADESLATLAVERCLRLLKPGTGRLGLVLPLAVACSTEPAFATLRRVIATEPGLWLWSHFDRTPNALFGRGVRARCSLVLYARSAEVPGHQWAPPGLLRWRARARGHLFATLRYARLDLDISAGIPKVASQLQADVLQRLLAAGPPLGMDLGTAAAAGATVYVGGSACNWFPAWRELPETFDRPGVRPALQLPGLLVVGRGLRRVQPQAMAGAAVPAGPGRHPAAGPAGAGRARPEPGPGAPEPRGAQGQPGPDRQLPAAGLRRGDPGHRPLPGLGSGPVPGLHGRYPGQQRGLQLRGKSYRRAGLSTRMRSRTAASGAQSLSRLRSAPVSGMRTMATCGQSLPQSIRSGAAAMSAWAIGVTDLKPS